MLQVYGKNSVYNFNNEINWSTYARELYFMAYSRRRRVLCHSFIFMNDEFFPSIFESEGEVFLEKSVIFYLFEV